MALAAPTTFGPLNAVSRAEIDALRRAGATVEVVAPSAAFRELTGNGTRLLDITLVADAYALGQRHAQSQLAAIRACWT